MGGKIIEYQKEIIQLTIVIGKFNRLTSVNFYIKEGEYYEGYV